MALFLGTDVINKKSPQDNLESCFYNHNELDLKNGFFREEEVFVWYYQSYVSDCYNFKPSPDVLKSAKMACVNNNLSLK